MYVYVPCFSRKSAAKTNVRAPVFVNRSVLTSLCVVLWGWLNWGQRLQDLTPDKQENRFHGAATMNIAPKDLPYLCGGTFALGSGRQKYTPPPWKPSLFSFSGSEVLWCIPFFPDLWCIPFALVFPGKWYTP